MESLGSGLPANRYDQIRILFVDDEPLVLEGLRRSVHKEYTADLAAGPEEGLAKLRSTGPYAVVVSDMRMPAMDGAEFLATVHAISPDSIRVMLTGCGDLESAKRAVNEGRVFRFLTKPVTCEQILTALVVFLLVAPVSTWADDDNATPPVQTSGSVSYMTGGVGEEEREAMFAATKNYTLKVVFALKQQAERLSKGRAP